MKLDALEGGMSPSGMEMSIFERPVQMSPPSDWDPPPFTKVEPHLVPGRSFCQQIPGISLLGSFRPEIASREHTLAPLFPPMPIADITNQSPTSHCLPLWAHLQLTVTPALPLFLGHAHFHSACARSICCNQMSSGRDLFLSFRSRLKDYFLTEVFADPSHTQSNIALLFLIYLP